MFFVFDTGALLRSGTIKLSSTPILERLAIKDKLLCPDTVLQEFQGTIQNPQYSSNRLNLQMLVSNHVVTIPSWYYNHCMPVLRKWYSHYRTKQIDGNTIWQTKMGIGEKHCLALALFLNRYEESQVCIVTDDFKARKHQLLCKFLEEQQMGWVVSSIEAGLYSTRYASSVTLSEVLAASLNYFQMFRGNLPKHKQMIENRILHLCRFMNSSAKICGFRCAH
ncbi:MAG: hypothetical protein ACFFER_05660 [Candidatus Thorarchaeota archaeon]